MNEEWLARFKKWNVFSKFILNVEALQIIVFVTFIVTAITLVIGGLLAGLSVHSSGGQITWLLTTSLFFLKVLLLEFFAIAILFLMKLPMGVVNLVEYLKDEWNDVMRKYRKEIGKDE